MNTLAAPVAPWWKHRWPWFLMAGPAIIMAATSYATYLAIKTPDAVVVGDYYKQGKAINQDLRRDHVAAQLGLSVKLGYDAANGLLTGSINRSDTGPLMLSLSHATQPAKDFKLIVVPAADGSFQARLPMLERSRWVVLVEGEKREWRLAGAWIWPKQREISLLPD
jgi:hypothetical protein